MMKKKLLIASAVLILAVLTCSFALSGAAQDEPELGLDYCHIHVFTQVYSETGYHVVGAECCIVEKGLFFSTSSETGYGSLLFFWLGTYTVTATYQGETLTQQITIEGELSDKACMFIFGAMSSPTPTASPVPGFLSKFFTSLGQFGLGLTAVLLVGIAIFAYTVYKKKRR